MSSSAVATSPDFAAGNVTRVVITRGPSRSSVVDTHRDRDAGISGHVAETSKSSYRNEGQRGSELGLKPMISFDTYHQDWATTATSRATGYRHASARTTKSPNKPARDARSLMKTDYAPPLPQRFWYPSDATKHLRERRIATAEPAPYRTSLSEHPVPRDDGNVSDDSAQAEELLEFVAKLGIGSDIEDDDDDDDGHSQRTTSAVR